MLVLIASRITQGDRPDDYCHTVEGELVTPLGPECCEPDQCGCGRGLVGLASARATTTAMVAHRPGITPDILRDAVADSLERGGWRNHDDPDDFDILIATHVDAIAGVVQTLGEGAIVRRDGDLVWADWREAA